MVTDKVGFEAVIGGLDSYLRGIQSMSAGNEQQAKSAQVAAAASVYQAESQLRAAQAMKSSLPAWASLENAENAVTQARQKQATVTAATESGNNRLVQTLKNSAMAAGQLLAVYGGFRILDAAIGQTKDFGDAVYRLQLLTGQSAESASGLLYGAEKLGVGFDKVSAAARIFSRNMVTVQEENDGFTGGAKTTKEILESMGIAIMDANGNLLPFDNLLGQVADKFQAMKNPVQEAGLAAQLFSRNGAAMLPILQLGAKGIQDFQAQAKALGHELSQDDVNAIHDYVIASREFNASLHGLEIQVGEALMPKLTEFSEWFQRHQPEIRAFLRTLISDVSDVAKEFGQGFDLIKGALGWLPANQVAVVAAVTAIGAAFAWAIPGGPVALGIAGIIAGLGTFESFSTKAAHFIDTNLDLSQANENKQFGILGGGDLSKADSDQADAAKKATDATTDFTDGLSKLPTEALKARSELGYLGDTLAGLALNAARAATTALFGQPTQEQAQLQLKLAQLNYQQLLQAGGGGSTTPTTIADYGGGTPTDTGFGYGTNANPNADTGQASAAAPASSSAVMITGAITQGFATTADLLRLQIEQTKQTASDLDAAFKKNNEALQRQINAAIGRGDTGTALSLVSQQRTATAQYRSQAAGLQTTEEAQNKQLTLLQLQQQSTTATTANTKAIAASTTATTAHTTATNANAKATTATTTKQTTAIEKQIAQVQHAIDLEKARQDVMKASLVVADKSLLTDGEQVTAYQDLLKYIGQASGAYRLAAEKTGDNLIPEIDKTKGALADMTQFGITTTKEELIKLMQAARDAGLKLNTIATASVPTASATVSPTGANSTKVQTTGYSTSAGATVGGGASSTKVQTMGSGGFYTGTPGTADYTWHSAASDAPLFDVGGIVTAPTFARLAGDGQPEAILPLSNISRARQIMAAIPASILSSILPRMSGPSAIFGSLSVSGFTLGDMEATAHRAVSDAFRQAKNQAGRAGSNLPIPLGAGVAG